MITENKKVLIVEDDDIDAIALESAIHNYSRHVAVQRAKDGEEALRRITASDPDLVLMDIKMPRMDGREALTKIKRDENISRTPVIMMSTSEDEDDVDFCYRHHCNAYVVKPIGFDMSTEVVRNILNFWLRTAVQ